jgi:hypothetical protein
MTARRPAHMLVAIASVLSILALASHTAAATRTVTEEKEPTTAKKQLAGPRQMLLFDGKSLAGWKKTNFGGEGDVTVENGTIIMEMGSPMTGITYDGKPKLPKTNYEISLLAKRLDGVDFFCALTFPVEDSHCTFVVGGWAGAVVGISSIDGYDASQNKTTKYESFQKDRWYRIRVRVRGRHLEAWIDKKKMVDFDATNHQLSTRIEVDLSKPLGISSFITRSALKDIELRPLDPVQDRTGKNQIPQESKR